MPLILLIIETIAQNKGAHNRADVPSQKTVQRGETRLKLLATSHGTTQLELLASPRVRTLRGMPPLKPLAYPWYDSA